MDGEKIRAIGDGLNAGSCAAVIDATGMYILPGGLGSHTHVALPFGGQYTRGFEATPAAAEVG